MFSGPADRAPLLLIASSEKIEVLYLNGSQMSARSPVKGSAVVTLDYSYREDSLCWIESRDVSSQLKCSRISRAGTFPEEWTINIAQYLHSKYWQCFSSCPGKQEPAESAFGLAGENSPEALNIVAHTEEILGFFTPVFSLRCSVCIYAMAFSSVVL